MTDEVHRLAHLVEVALFATRTLRLQIQTTSVRNCNTFTRASGHMFRLRHHRSFRRFEGFVRSVRSRGLFERSEPSLPT